MSTVLSPVTQLDSPKSNLVDQYYGYDTFIETEQREPGLDLK